jgi:hypothetical protein
MHKEINDEASLKVEQNPFRSVIGVAHRRNCSLFILYKEENKGP